MKLPFRKNKFSRGARFVVMTDGDSDVHQWSFSQSTLVGFSVLAIVLCGALLFFSADFLTRLLYNSRLEEIKQDNRSLISTLVDLRSRIDQMEMDINAIEEKDRALRTYANLPLIDADVRKLGVGGPRLSKKSGLGEILPDVETKIAELEIDLDELARKVSLEKESFESIYNAVRDNFERLSSIPSLKPVEGGYLNTGYGYRRDPFTGERRFHYGQDISAPRGTPVYAAADGKVVYASYKGSYGKTVKLNHRRGYQSLYAHLNKIYVKKNQKIKRGDLIGEVGNTGRSTAPHLHYEVHYYGTPQNPNNYFFTGYLK